MANPVRINAATLNRPGVFVTQSSTGSLPEPIATHAVGYLFGTTPTEDYCGTDAINTYSTLEPYTPTQIASVQDYIDKIGGEIPVGNKGALASYDAVSAFFDNVGVNGILYFTRVTPTPETVIDLGASAAGAGFNAFALKVNGRYFGTPIGLFDENQVEIKVITTTALNKQDNARDIFVFLADNGDDFADYYRIEQTPQEALSAKFRIFSKDSRSIPEVEAFKAYQFQDNSYGESLDLLDSTGVVNLYTSIKELNFRCVSRNIENGEPILFETGSAISAFIANTIGEAEWDIETQQSDILKAFLTSGNGNPYASESAIPEGKIIAISKDLTSGNPTETKWADGDAVYWIYQGDEFTKIDEGFTVPGGATDGFEREGYLPDTVQVFYVNVAGEDRAIIVNGANPDELAKNLALEIRNILTEKELDSYYSVEAIDYPSIEGAYFPNNGRTYSADIGEAGSPYIRPEPCDFSLTGTIVGESGTIGGNGTSFTTELAPGDIFVANGTRFTVTSIDSDEEMSVTPSEGVPITQPTSFSLDRSLPNGFYSFDYVLRIKVTSNNGISSPVNSGRNRFGEFDPNVAKVVSLEQNVNYEGYKLTQTAKGHDFVYAIEQGMGSKNLAPGFLFAPEAYTILTYDADGGPTNNLLSKSEARAERLKITQSLTRVAEGRLGQTEGITGTQFIALIDCGADELSLSDVRDELSGIKSTVGVPFGHSAFYAPYIKNLSDRYVAPSAFVAGIACSRYINEGFQQPPAGARYPLRGAIGLKFDISAQQQEVTYALGLNPIRSLPNRGIVTWGARTLSSNALFKFVNTRAILNVLVDVMSRSFDDLLFEQIDSAGTVYARVKSIASQICGQFFRQGALFGARPEQAYLVVCSSANNSDLDLENGTVRLDVYVATSPTLERMLITIVRTPAGQVTQLSDSFSRNEARFSALLTNTTVLG